MTHLTTPGGTPASRFAFGAMQFGGKADETAARAMYDAARAAGITHFDTAHGYTGGASETLLGNFARAERDNLLIATKVGNSGDLSPPTIAAELDLSLRRLNLGGVDVLYLHRFDPNTELAATLEALAQHREAGRFRYLGVSNYAAWQVMKARAIAADFGLTVDIFQPMYNLLKRQAEVEILPMCADQGITVAPYSPLGGGMLTGKYTSGGTGRIAEDTMYAARYAGDWMRDAATALSDIAAEVGTHPATLAVAWVAAHRAAPVPIVSARSAEQLAPSLAAMRFDMTPDLYARLSALTPAPPPATDRTEEA